MTKEKIDEVDYEEIKAAKENGLTSKECADEMNIELSIVNKVYSSVSYESYSGIKKSGAEIVSPAQSGYYKSLIAKKHEENEQLKDTRGWLLEQISFLRKSVSFLELRKRELEDGIKKLEQQVRIGVDIIEKLEENNHFDKLK